jgi:hypothetical protein
VFSSGVIGTNAGQGIGVAGRVTPAGAGKAIYGDNNSGSGYAGYFNGNVYATGTITQNSDVRLKKNVKGIEGPVGQVLKLHGVTFEWKDPKEHTGPGVHLGFIAQDVEKIFPHWVGTDDKGFKTLDTREIDALLVESVRALKAENDALRDRVKALEDKRSASAVAWTGPAGLLGSAGVVLFAGALLLSRRRDLVRRS